MNGAEGFPVRAACAEAWGSWWDEEAVGFDLCEKIKLAVNLFLDSSLRQQQCSLPSWITRRRSQALEDRLLQVSGSGIARLVRVPREPVPDSCRICLRR